MVLLRRIDLAEREFLSRSVRRVVQQAARDAGDGPSTYVKESGIGAAGLPNENPKPNP